MEGFAPESYYDDIIAKAVALGYRFIAKVCITTDDMPYYIQVTSARVTCITFDIPDKAVFFNLHHNEHFGFMEENYSNHWSFVLDYDFGSYEEILCKTEEKIPNCHQALPDIWSPFDERIERPIDNVSYGWSSRVEHQWTHSGDISGISSDIVVPADFVTHVLESLLDDRIYYATDKFKELSPLWPPTYTFSGSRVALEDWAVHSKREQKLTSLYWERFGENRKILSEKIIRLI